jgi:hypothetical protein
MMASAYKVLGQVAPAATTETTLYEVPTGTEAVVSALLAVNRSVSQVTVRVAVRPGGATIANEHYVAFDVPLAASQVLGLPSGLTLGEGDVLTVRASSADTSFSVFGVELT